jgi:RHS repeat-associated protein
MLAIAAAEPTRTSGAALPTAEPHVCAPIDANGNLTSDGTRTLGWDATDRLVNAAIGSNWTEYSYDGNGQQLGVSRSIAQTVVEQRQLLWCGAAICEERDLIGSTVTRRFKSGTSASGTNRLHVTDHLGSLSDVTDGNAALVSRYAYDPFGRPSAPVGDVASAAFTGHALEPQLNVYITRTRAYDPSLGRWLSRDPLGLDASPNDYGYVSGNPTGFVDPLGLVEVRWQVKTRFGDPDISCGPSGGACSKAGIAVTGYCKETSCGQYQLSTILTVAADIVVFPGKFPYKGKKPKDPKVHDAESAFYHEFDVHLFPAASAAAQVLSMFEQNLYPTKVACDAALGTARTLAAREFRRALDRTMKSDQ